MQDARETSCRVLDGAMRGVPSPNFGPLALGIPGAETGQTDVIPGRDGSELWVLPGQPEQVKHLAHGW